MSPLRDRLLDPKLPEVKLLVVHLGTNDEGKSLLDFRASIRLFIDEVRSLLDRVAIVFSEVLPRCPHYKKYNDNERATAFNARLEDFNEALALVCKEDTRARTCVMRHTFADPDNRDLYSDSVHLSPRGARLLARELDAEIGRLLHELDLDEKMVPGSTKSSHWHPRRQRRQPPQQQVQEVPMMYHDVRYANKPEEVLRINAASAGAPSDHDTSMATTVYEDVIPNLLATPMWREEEGATRVDTRPMLSPIPPVSAQPMLCPVPPVNTQPQEQVHMNYPGYHTQVHMNYPDYQTTQISQISSPVHMNYPNYSTPPSSSTQPRRERTPPSTTRRMERTPPRKWSPAKRQRTSYSPVRSGTFWSRHVPEPERNTSWWRKPSATVSVPPERTPSSDAAWSSAVTETQSSVAPIIPVESMESMMSRPAPATVSVPQSCRGASAVDVPNFVLTFNEAGGSRSIRKPPTAPVPQVNTAPVPQENTPQQPVLRGPNSLPTQIEIAQTRMGINFNKDRKCAFNDCTDTRKFSCHANHFISVHLPRFLKRTKNPGRNDMRLWAVLFNRLLKFFKLSTIDDLCDMVMANAWVPISRGPDAIANSRDGYSTIDIRMVNAFADYTGVPRPQDYGESQLRSPAMLINWRVLRCLLQFGMTPAQRQEVCMFPRPAPGVWPQVPRRQ